MHQIKQEIFAVGKWNGMEFTQEDLRKMVVSFESLRDYQKVPLKLGHNDEQPVLDGQPALGWVEKLEVVGNKLVAVFDHVPDIMMKAFEKKLYRNVSIELDFAVKHKSGFYDFVITAVALLGADIPAVNVLNDLGALMSKNSFMAQSEFIAGSHASFNAISGNKETFMPLSEDEERKLRDQLAAAQNKLQETTQQFSTFKADAEKEAGEWKQRFEKLESETKKAQVESARSKFTKILEEAVTEKRITPAQRDAFSKALRIDDDDAVLTLTEETVKAMLPETGGKGYSKDTGRNPDDDERSSENPGDELSRRAYSHMSKSGEKNFSRALDVVMAADPQLAKEYILSNGEKEVA